MTSFAEHPRSKQWSSLNKCKPQDVPLYYYKPFWFDCEKCEHSFEASLNSIARIGSWCSYCGNKKLCNNLKCKVCYKKSFASQTKSLFWSAQNKDSPRDYFKSGSQKKLFDCPTCSLTFPMTLNNVTNGKWCKPCGRATAAIKQRLTKEEFINRSIIIHGPQYKYSEVVYVNCDTPVKIMCSLHGYFEQTPWHHYADGNGCPDCAIIKRTDKNRFTLEEFITRAKMIHGDKYDYSQTVYADSQSDILIVCPHHGSFTQVANSHLQGCGCYQCGIEKRSKAQALTTEDFIVRANIAHNNLYSYEKTNYISGHKKIIITCVKHGDFLQDPFNHLKGFGCRKCAPISYSRAQIEMLSFLEELWKSPIQHAENSGELHIPNTKFKADGYIQSENLIIEFHGDYWHGNPKIYPSDKLHPVLKKTYGDLYSKTCKRDEELQNRGFRVKVIWELSWINAKSSVTLIQRQWRDKHRTRSINPAAN